MYKIRLPNFEGPFDLLLYFIKRDELNIYDIPIARITGEYLKYIRLMKFFDLELAGEFLVMVATLMYIKTQMLLPKNESEDDELEDPRTVLVQRLIEYKQFKEASQDLSEMSEDQRYVFYRRLFNPDNSSFKNNDDVYYENSTLFDLLRAFKTALDRTQGGIKEHVINIHPASIEDKTAHIIQILKMKKRLRFFEMIEGENRRNIIVIFLALLEMIKDSLIFIQQDDIYNDIVIAEKPAAVLEEVSHLN